MPSQRWLKSVVVILLATLAKFVWRWVRDSLFGCSDSLLLSLVIIIFIAKGKRIGKLRFSSLLFLRTKHWIEMQVTKCKLLDWAMLSHIWILLLAWNSSKEEKQNLPNWIIAVPSQSLHSSLNPTSLRFFFSSAAWRFAASYSCVASSETTWGVMSTIPVANNGLPSFRSLCGWWINGILEWFSLLCCHEFDGLSIEIIQRYELSWKSFHQSIASIHQSKICMQTLSFWPNHQHLP